MKKFIEEILSIQTFLDVLYNFGSFYKDYDYEANMIDFYNSSDKKLASLVKIQNGYLSLMMVIVMEY